MRTPEYETAEQLRERELKTAATLRDIGAHISRLQLAKQEREVAISRIRARLALFPAQASTDADAE